MRTSGVPSAVRNSRVARSPRGRRAVAAVCVLAALPLAACAPAPAPRPLPRRGQRQYWCGNLCTGFPTSGADAYFANPATLARKRIPAGPLSGLDPGFLNFVWAGDAIIAVSTVFGRDGSPAHPILSGDMALYDPAAQRWTGLPATPGHPAMASAPVRTGTELLTLTTAGSLLAFRR